ncbi:hypothetical protein ACFWPH_19410 [Nocardia sp. NPDC058499]|uniref:hypothetical protein n=1 Tax=Nocardia sp. NPDC058499 TaxID=3346530 RepID=UPI0036498783
MPESMRPHAEARTAPATVRTAVYFMLAGALVTLLWAGLGFFDSHLAQDPIALLFSVLSAIAQAGLWIWIALASEAGKKWARITATVLFALVAVLFIAGLVLIALLTTSVPVMGIDGSPAARIAANTVLVGLGLGAVIALWHPNSTDHFAAIAPVRGNAPGSWPVAGNHPTYPSPETIPRTVRRAVRLMQAGAALTVLIAVVGFVDDTAVLEAPGEPGTGLGDSGSSPVFLEDIIATVATTAIQAGLWLWIAAQCRAGKGWARISGTIFFAINLVAFTGLTAVALLTGIGLSVTVSVLNIGIVGLGLAAVIALWHRNSGGHFSRASTTR